MKLIRKGSFQKKTSQKWLTVAIWLTWTIMDYHGLSFFEFSSFTNYEKHRRGGGLELHFITSKNPNIINLEEEFANIYYHLH